MGLPSLPQDTLKVRTGCGLVGGRGVSWCGVLVTCEGGREGVRVWEELILAVHLFGCDWHLTLVLILF